MVTLPSLLWPLAVSTTMMPASWPPAWSDSMPWSLADWRVRVPSALIVRVSVTLPPPTASAVTADHVLGAVRLINLRQGENEPIDLRACLAGGVPLVELLSLPRVDHGEGLNRA